MKFASILLLAAHFSIAQTSEIKLFNFQNSTCNQDSDPSRLRTRIIRKEMKDGIFTIQIATSATCCVTFIPKAIFYSGILDLNFGETGTPCECSCCYEFTYHISGVKDDHIPITFMGKEIEESDEKYKTYPVRYEILNGDTINLVDKYGFRQGLWLSQQPNVASMRHLIFSDGRPVRVVTFFPDGKIESELINEKIRYKVEGKERFDYGDFNRYFEYHTSGQKKKECYNGAMTMFNSYEKGKCKEWNEKGELVYEGAFRK